MFEEMRISLRLWVLIVYEGNGILIFKFKVSVGLGGVTERIAMQTHERCGRGQMVGSAP